MKGRNRDAFIKYLRQFLSEIRQKRIASVLNQRTRYLTVVLEDIHKPHNASAVIRTSECMGLQDIHIIENENSYEVNKGVVMGSAKWLNLHRYRQQGVNNTAVCFDRLREEGYKIVAATPHEDQKLIADIAIDEKIALVFGTELHGLTDFALKHADESVRIPIYGFTESYNLSVSVAICLNTLIEKLRQSSVKWHLRRKEKSQIMLSWLKKNIKNWELHEEEFLRRFQ